jgi:predicted enzyme related to lactoylglutathione lyase
MLSICYENRLQRFASLRILEQMCEFEASTSQKLRRRTIVPNPIVHFEIVGKEGKKLQNFYGSLFDWKVDANNEWNYGMVDTETPGAGIAGGIGPTMDGQSRVTVYAQVPDLQAYLDKAEKLGGKTLMPPTEIPGAVTMAMFSDPEGNVMGMIKG